MSYIILVTQIYSQFFIQKIFILELNIYFALVMAKWLLNLFFLSTPIHTMVINLSKYSPLFFSLASKLHDYCKQNKTQNFLTRFLRLCSGFSPLSNFSHGSAQLDDYF